MAAKAARSAADPFGRRGVGGERAAELGARDHQFDELALLRRARRVLDRRRVEIGRARTGLRDHRDLLLGEPGRLGGLPARPGVVAGLDLAALHGEIDLVAARIAGHDLELAAENSFIVCGRCSVMAHVAEWSYYLLAMAMPTLALWIVWRLSADYLDAEKRVAGLALLMLVPFFNFHALKLNVNTVLMPAWAAATFWFLRSYRTRGALYAALAGAGAAACMLGKYWSVFLLVGLAIAALIDKRRAVYFRSAAPWLTVVAGLAVLAPHLIWLYRHDFAPFDYAMTVHGSPSLAATAYSALGYLAGSIGYVAIPVIVVLAAARPSRATLADMVVAGRCASAGWRRPHSGDRCCCPPPARWPAAPRSLRCGRCRPGRCCRCCCYRRRR